MSTPYIRQDRALLARAGNDDERLLEEPAARRSSARILWRVDAGHRLLQSSFDYWMVAKEDITTIGSSTSLAALAIALAVFMGGPSSFAQTSPPAARANQEHGMHHPDAKPESRPGDMGMMGQGGAMGGCMMGRRGGRVGDMMQMIQQMMTMMSVESGVMVAHVEGRIAELKSELKITDVQVPQWNRFADAMRSVAKSMAGIHHEVMEGRTGKTLPERLASRAKAFAAHLAVVKAMEDAL